MDRFQDMGTVTTPGHPSFIHSVHNFNFLVNLHFCSDRQCSEPPPRLPSQGNFLSLVVKLLRAASALPQRPLRYLFPFLSTFNCRLSTSCLSLLHGFLTSILPPCSGSHANLKPKRRCTRSRCVR